MIKRNTLPRTTHIYLPQTAVLCHSWNQRNREGQLVDIPGDPDGRKLHVEYLSVRDSYDLAGKKRKDPNHPKGKRGGLVRREYRLVSRDYGISPRPPPPHQAIVAPTQPVLGSKPLPTHPSP